jgi:AraC-like DNA-binding protein
MDLVCEERPSDSPLIATVWHANSGEGGTFLSMAGQQYGMVITKIQGTLRLTVRGPETRATEAASPPDAEFVGIQFKPGVYLKGIPASRVIDRNDVNLPGAGSRSFWLNGSAWQFPDFENIDTFIEWLERDGLLVHDPLVDDVLQGRSLPMSLRTVQRRFLHATGLTQNDVRLIERARYATTLLKQGVPILDTVYMAGYADQPHMTRALKLRAGMTPAQIINKERSMLLSILFQQNYVAPPETLAFQPAQPDLPHLIARSQLQSASPLPTY